MPRYLTPSEIALIRPIFQHALDYAAIHIHARRYLPLQNAHTAMSPNGNSYYPRALCCANFAHGTWQQRHLFIHECSHIWQHRLAAAAFASRCKAATLPTAPIVINTCSPVGKI